MVPGRDVEQSIHFIQAGMEVSSQMGQMSSRLGYQPTMGTELSQLEERISNTEHRRDLLDPGGVCAGG